MEEFSTPFPQKPIQKDEAKEQVEGARVNKLDWMVPAGIAAGFFAAVGACLVSPTFAAGSAALSTFFNFQQQPEDLGEAGDLSAIPLEDPSPLGVTGDHAARGPIEMFVKDIMKTLMCWFQVGGRQEANTQFAHELASKTHDDAWVEMGKEGPIELETPQVDPALPKEPVAADTIPSNV